MNSTNESKLRKIEHASNVIRGVSKALVVPVAIIAVAATVSILAGWTARISYLGQDFLPATMELPARLLLAAVVIGTALVLLKCLHHLRRLAGNYARREIFTADSARQVRQFGIACILWGIVKAVWAFLPLAIKAEHPPVYYASTDTIFLGVIFIGLSWFAEMAADLREENDLTV